MPAVHPHAPIPTSTGSWPGSAPVSATSATSAVTTPWQPGAYSSPSAAGVSLSPGAELIPQKLVAKVLSGAYVDMKELLSDNISLLQQLESFNMTATLPALPAAMKPRLREVNTLASWLYCFLAYTALRCPDQELRDRMVYARLMKREAQRQGGQGWLEYDKAFRQHAALDPSLKWNVLNSDIKAGTLFNHSSHTSSPTGGGGSFCSHCREVDHPTTSCALAYLHQPTQVVSVATSQPPGWPFRKRTTVASHSLCISWNRGRCLYPSSCSYRHVCSVCFQQHPAIDCPNRSSRSSSRDRAPGPTMVSSSRP